MPTKWKTAVCIQVDLTECYVNELQLLGFETEIWGAGGIVLVSASSIHQVRRQTSWPIGCDGV